MIGRFQADLNSVPAIAGKPAVLPIALYSDQFQQTPAVLTGFTALFTLESIDASGNATHLTTATTSNNGISISGGVITLNTANMSPAPTIPAGAHRYTFELYNASNILECTITGTWTFDPDRSP